MVIRSEPSITTAAPSARLSTFCLFGVPASYSAAASVTMTALPRMSTTWTPEKVNRRSAFARFCPISL
ncbi:hypothetical protein D3C81_2310000 [compost metagenome]